MAHRIVRALVRITVESLAALAILVLVISAYVGYSEYMAKRRAVEFCASLKVGEPSDTLLERAKSSGAEERRTQWMKGPNEERWLSVTFTGYSPISRHICWITGTKTVKTFAYVYLD